MQISLVFFNFDNIFPLPHIANEPMIHVILAGFIRIVVDKYFEILKTYNLQFCDIVVLNYFQTVRDFCLKIT